MSCWLLSIIYVISTCAATEILYVLPDSVSDVDCPSQPCATLGQYLLDNDGSLPVLSDVEYHFLPGKHHVANNVDIEEAFNFSLIGFDLSPAKLICKSYYYVGVFLSYNITIRNLAFSQCSGNVGNKFAINAAASLFLYRCSHCIIENVNFFGYGFVGFNLLQNCYLSNIGIKPATSMCSLKFILKFVDVKDSQTYLFINQINISGYSELCLTEDQKLMQVYADKSYGLHIEFRNLQFYYVTQPALDITLKHTSALILFKNSTFMYSKIDTMNNVIHCKIPTNNVTIRFENCAFYFNVVSFNLLLLNVESDTYDGSCVHPSNVTIGNCKFIGNNGRLILLSGISTCKSNIFFNDVMNFVKNEANFLIYIEYMIVKINGMITVLENIVKERFIEFKTCEVTFTKTILFLSNLCHTFVTIMSDDIEYIKIMEFANITLHNNSYHHLFSREQVTNNYVEVYPYCIFQYMTLTNDTHTISELLALYTISLSENKQVKKSSMMYSDVYDFLTHCKWLPTAAFNGHDPEYINQQIIEVDSRQWIHHKQICYCPHDGPYNCTVDLLGPVYPGQMLQVELCIPQAESEAR